MYTHYTQFLLHQVLALCLRYKLHFTWAERGPELSEGGRGPLAPLEPLLVSTSVHYKSVLTSKRKKDTHANFRILAR